MPEWTLYARGADGRRVAQVDDFTSLDAVLRFNRTGSWLLDMPAGNVAASALLADHAGLIAVRDGLTLFSGRVTGRQRKWDDQQDSLTLSGPTDDVWLDRRLALPVPSGPPYTAAAYDVRTGTASTVLRGYVDANAGPGARPERAVPGLILPADPLLGTTVTGRARFQNLHELLRPLALAAGDLGYRIVQDGLSLLFEVYQPADRTRTAVFSPEFGNLKGFDYTAEDAEANYVLAAGGGEGTARILRERGDSASIVRHGRIEVFKDQRQTTDPAELDQAVTEELAERAERSSLRISPVDTDRLAFGRDYFLGDRVTVVPDGVPISDVLREVRLQLDGSGEQVTPTVGTPDNPRSVLGLFSQVRRLSSRLSNIERR